MKENQLIAQFRLGDERIDLLYRRSSAAIEDLPMFYELLRWKDHELREQKEWNTGLIGFHGLITDMIFQTKSK